MEKIEVVRIRAMTRTELAQLYNVNIRTLNKWMKQFPELPKKCTKCILTPAEVTLIFQKIGEP